jgi:hypothetical protein
MKRKTAMRWARRRMRMRRRRRRTTTATERLEAAARVAVVASIARTILTKKTAVATSRLQSHLGKVTRCFHCRSCQNETPTTMVVVTNPIIGRTLMRTTLLPPSVWLLVHFPVGLLLLEFHQHWS